MILSFKGLIERCIHLSLILVVLCFIVSVNNIIKSNSNNQEDVVVGKYSDRSLLSYFNVGLSDMIYKGFQHQTKPKSNKLILLKNGNINPAQRPSMSSSKHSLTNSIPINGYRGSANWMQFTSSTCHT
ncbi:hypothetical protein PPL_05859 [Heterostelium album PN500]|uniref:Uncharacterized protein n=1 Tax=Heterostelium pallidum (strain ATCC 26659 / Pp 5 / PN500) TaxID=670386 RepID=D3BBJ1_HETP5|nr:hypothetical protein PPL_05859 [Heterostelium album PN500]EFA81024.1 hypothetical protein PPL_05859 [Heterostelium album PN500]|eukprot:XP_020433142.1 hypothetical protein PPL_05859 [Heterostelium album PN500]